MTNSEMADYWNTRGGRQWVTHRDRYDTMLAPCGGRLLQAAELAEGESVLDVGCGNGATTIEAAGLVGSASDVVGVDLSAPMLEVARARAAQAGVAATFIQGDAQIMSFEVSFDVVISRFGVMFFDDPAAAFANLAGWLRPAGRLCFVCWQDMLANQWIAVAAMAVVGHVGLPEAPAPDAPGPFALADPGRIRSVLEGAGLADVQITPATDRLLMGSDVDDVVAFMATDEMGRRLLEDKEPEKVSLALDAARHALGPYCDLEGVLLEAAYWVVTARRL